jgi:hypothetical protein
MIPSKTPDYSRWLAQGVVVLNLMMVFTGLVLSWD